MADRTMMKLTLMLELRIEADSGRRQIRTIGSRRDFGALKTGPEFLPNVRH